MVTINALASRMKMMHKANEAYVPLIGAGCSYNSGVKDSSIIKQEIIKIVTDKSDFNIEKFDVVWRELSDREQEAAIGGYFKEKTPSKGYYALCDIAIKGFFDLILTTNFDDFIERVLEKKGKDFRVFVVGVDEEKNLQKFLEDKNMDIRILKLHGDYRKSYYKYSLDTLLEFHPDVKDIFTKVSGNDMIVCGYAFNDLDILRALNLDEGGVYFVNINYPNRIVKEILRRKNSDQNCICRKEGDFDNFFTRLLKLV